MSSALLYINTATDTICMINQENRCKTFTYLLPITDYYYYYYLPTGDKLIFELIRSYSFTGTVF